MKKPLIYCLALGLWVHPVAAQYQLIVRENMSEPYRINTNVQNLSLQTSLSVATTIDTFVNKTTANVLQDLRNDLVDRLRFDLIALLSGEERVRDTNEPVNRIFDAAVASNQASDRLNDAPIFNGSLQTQLALQLQQGSQVRYCTTEIECLQNERLTFITEGYGTGKAKTEQWWQLAQQSKCSTDDLNTLDPQIAASCGPEITNLNDTTILNAYKSCVQQVQAQQPMMQLTDGRVAQTTNFSLQLQTVQENCEAIRASYELNQEKLKQKLMAAWLEARAARRGLETNRRQAEVDREIKELTAQRLQTTYLQCELFPGSCGAPETTSSP